MDFRQDEAAGTPGAVYIGKVRNVVKNLNAAFVEYQPGVNGYYSFNDNRTHLFADGRIAEGTLKSGDEILVQVARAAVKTKDAVLTGNLCLTGRYAVVQAFGTELGISAKITQKKWRDECKAWWETIDAPDCSVIIRTNAYGVSFEEILADVRELAARLEKIRRDAAFRTVHSVLYQPDSFVVAAVRDLNITGETEVVTDIPEVYEELQAANLADNPAVRLRLYDDSYPLTALYHLESTLDRALGKTVWLKSGGYLVIEPTEAMTVIDVNTGKNVQKKSSEEVYFRTNLEAASEIANQIRLRNLSGIILVDFIDMKEEAHNAELLSTFRKYLNADPVRTILVDMTALGLVEITRKKIRRPLHEQVKRRGVESAASK